MGSLSETEIPNVNFRLLSQPQAGGSAASRKDKSSLAVVMRELTRSFPGWLFFVVAILILLNGHRFI